jgi:hypothetical protein
MDEEFKLYISGKDLLHIGIVIILLALTSAVSYWLGSLEGNNKLLGGLKTGQSGIINDQAATITFNSDNQADQSDNTANTKDAGSTVKGDKASQTYVASKNGTKYYPSDCAGANRIKAENQVIFGSTKEAEDAGYEAATNC